MWLAASLQVNSGEQSVYGDRERRHTYLCQIHVHFLPAIDAGYRASIRYRESDLRCQYVVNATLHRSRVHKCLDSNDTWDRRR